MRAGLGGSCATPERMRPRARACPPARAPAARQPARVTPAPAGADFLDLVTSRV